MKIEKLVVGSYQENCYFLIKNNNLIIVDPGDEFKRIDEKIINDNLNLVAILITHAHFDHIGALEELIKKYNVPVYYNNVNNEIIYDNLVNVTEKEYNIKLDKNYDDTATMIYDYKENIYAGGSGPACMPLVVYSSIIPKMKQRIIKKVLLIATGALMSPTTCNQKFSIPSVSHAVCLEVI